MARERQRRSFARVGAPGSVFADLAEGEYFSLPGGSEIFLKLTRRNYAGSTIYKYARARTPVERLRPEDVPEERQALIRAVLEGRR